ncbi:bifunctional PIG-L family deacetylase/class I SAM-dependent methyltransferase [Kineococcus rhizosphaerae]|uniref:LmbE family N-acetylglucosaminyl deacetylase n=1 Tax=Kineococcus rhizosphaerae TaxID=559628 RepID=A0A2T0R3C4_9ACTN|nr:bifunctional PIG-L family deacetylase/class I SAM-dependent methyltransferase [Kineococcus rhizosphaerae]PRY14552.1 LmbE family N-acetylglucosaminyl deacetylase [Kineococcus rhizosphaerae]
MALVNDDPAVRSSHDEFTHDSPGTPEQDWARWPGLRDVPALDWAGVEHVLVVAAHPDDETLGAGGLIATAAARGLPVDVVVATDGEGSHPASPTTTPRELAERRGEEVRHAVSTLAPGAHLHRLRVPDGGVGGDRAVLAARLTRLVRGGTLLVAPWTGDGHPDHDVAGAVAAQVAAERGARCVHYPVWVWHWSHPGDVRIPWSRGVSLDLDPDAHRRKQEAMAAHVSQTEPLSAAPGDEVLLAPGVLEHFGRDAEFFLAGQGAGRPRSLGAEFFEGFYAEHGDDPWGFEDRWYERRKRALTLASLPRERFRNGLEIGCSAGVFSVELAQRCESLLAVDISPSALERARARVPQNVRTQVARVPQEFPDGEFDLVVLAEVAYYCDPDDLRDLVERLRACLSPDGVLVACHWRHLVEDYPLTGDEVHRTLRGAAGLDLLARHEEEDFLLDVLVPAPVVSVARAGGLV